MRSLNGTDLSGFIKERQAREVRSLKQSENVAPRLDIVRTNPDPVVDSYMKLKQSYGDDIGVEVVVHTIDQTEALNLIKDLNEDKDVHGIIIQIPLPDPSQTDEVLNAVTPDKDVDGLAVNTKFEPATPMAINWILAGYNVELAGKTIVVVGQGRLVGRPLAEMFKSSGHKVLTADKHTEDLAGITARADILICATGRPGLITKEMIKGDAVIVDAGVATDSNGLVGDVDKSVRELTGITITPEKGGVGPLTVCALFENVLRSARLYAGRRT